MDPLTALKSINNQAIEQEIDKMNKSTANDILSKILVAFDKLTVDVHQGLQEKEKANVGKIINGKELYDYSKFLQTKNILPLISSGYDSNDTTLISEFDKNFITQIKSNVWNLAKFDSYKNEILRQITDFIDNLIQDEIPVIYYKKKLEQNSFIQKDGHFVITNYGNILYCEEDNNNTIFKVISYYNNFWLPIDYIHILKYIKYTELNKIIVNIKDTLYNRAFVPHYVTNIVSENEKLKNMYDAHQKDVKTFQENKQIFEVEAKPYTDLIQSKKDLEKEKQEYEENKQKQLKKLGKIKKQLADENIRLGLLQKKLKDQEKRLSEIADTKVKFDFDSDSEGEEISLSDIE